MKRLKQVQAARLALSELGSAHRIMGRIGISFGLGALFLWLFSTRVQELDLDQLQRSVLQMSWGDWLSASVLTGLAFWAVGHYDALLHRHFCTHVDSARARRAGICAIAVSQSLGLGVLTGAILRWRMLPEQSLIMASKITLAVALSFLGAWAIVTSTVVIAQPNAAHQDVAYLVLAVAIGAIALSIAAPKVRFRWPNGFTIAGLIVFCAIDSFAAAFAFYIFLPAEIASPFFAILPAFLLAYGAGLVSGAPGGIGAFEVTLLALLPHLPSDHVLAAIVAWRLIYFVAPAILGAIVAILGPAPQATSPFALVQLPRQNCRAETGIVAQGEHGLIGQNGRAKWVVGRRNHVLVGLFDPIGGHKDALEMLQNTARAEARWPVIYKASASLAGLARGAGWRVVRSACEAVIDPQGYDLTHVRRAGLRRKLRRAKMVQIVQKDHDQPWADLDDIAAEWARLHGGERGFSMGRYARDYVSYQRIYIAYHQGQVMRFITLHETCGEWTLDLMRHRARIPDGTMHLLVHSAILDAAARGVARLSLAAVPQTAFLTLPNFMSRWTDSGLRQFKDSFAPRWEGRYFIAPHWFAAALGAISIAWAIAPKRYRHSDTLAKSDADTQYGFAPIGFAWQRDGDI